MANEILILRDSSSGAYYQLDRATLEAARVPEDRVAEVEQALAQEVTGYGLTPKIPSFEVLGAIVPSGPGHIDLHLHVDFAHHDVHHDSHYDTR